MNSLNPLSPFLILTTLGVASVASAQCPPHPQAVQWRVEDGGNGNWYARINTATLWPQAQLAAEKLGGHLATPTTAAENQFVGNLSIDGNLNVQHIGARKVGDTWQWVTGEKWSFTNWYPGEPNNNGGNEIYLATWVEPGTWNDIFPEYAAGYIVEWESPIANDCDANGVCDDAQVASNPQEDLNVDGILDVCQCLPYPTARQWRIEDGGNGNWYARIDTGVLWPQAKLAAERLGGHLATPTTEAENAFVGALSMDGYFNVKHLGGLKIGNKWQWITGEPWSFSNWYPGEPNNNGGIEIYLATWVTPGTWNDIYLEYAAGYLVEWELADLDCDSDGACDRTEIASNPGLDLNRDHVLDTCQCIADVVSDGAVDGADLARVISDWGMSSSVADINADGIVAGADIAIVLASWGPCAP